MITLKSAREIEAMHESGKLLASIHVQLRDFIKPGITTLDIDRFVQDKIESAGGIASQIGYSGYEFATCTSVNDEICHGFPTNRVLKSGDLVKVDFCIELNGGLSDSCWSYAVGELSPEHAQLMKDTHEAMMLGIEQAVIGNRIGDIGHAIQTFAEAKGYGVVRDFIGHGLGPTIHEEPAVPHYGKPGKGLRLKEGMTITIEPMITMGTWQMNMDANGWTARTRDGGYCAQYEHTLAITKEGPILLTNQNDI
ncbi:type I methionyl aminopeptidase [Aerococcaceae bacterium DSM 109653]|uniref:Methionine aminopeptidase n=1 Tax=Fundicoccus ignavus TaxID=2664442 RepID=A0A844BV67_9LACT|nr:type I methionyl aminopeptidase [Fundicoccus ignavus]MRI82022.1 type I methionyl aminopeptidase [Fundicoccus ignavus]